MTDKKYHEPRRFTNKPVTIEAIQYTEAIRDAHLFDGAPLPDGVSIPARTLRPKTRTVYHADAFIETLKGRMHVNIGDWIIKGMKGEIYSCKPDIFEATYAEADCAMRAAQAAALNMGDAYEGAREDLSIWKRRALEAEALNRKFAASVNGSTFMGEPASVAGPTKFKNGRCQHCIDRHDGVYGSWAPPCPYHDDDGNARKAQEAAPSKEAEWIAASTDLDCHACGGSGHIEDVREPAAVAVPDERESAKRLDDLYVALDVCSAELFAQCADQGRAMKYVEQARKALAAEQCSRAAISTTPTQPAPQPERNIEAEALEYIFGANLDWLRIVDEKLTPPWPRECHVIAMGMRHISQAAPSQDAGALARLRHLYANMVGGAVRDADGARRIAVGILGPAIERLERAAPSQDAEDAARYRWLAAHCRSTSEHWGGRWSIVIDGPAPKSHDSEDDFDAAIDAARKQEGM